MQIDFHHTVTYVAARIAGFNAEQAETIAYAAQYVDDAIVSGSIFFSNGALYTRMSSAHKAIDLQNLDDVENHMVWVPFHFLPGNGDKPAGQAPDGSFINRLICTPNSAIAKDMISAAFAQPDKRNSLHRLGITMHVYADTWAHQGFAGVTHEVNEVDYARDNGNSGVFDDLGGYLERKVEQMAPVLGHAHAHVFPDMPFLSWQYENSLKGAAERRSTGFSSTNLPGSDGQLIQRHNTDIFCEAANEICKTMQEFRKLSDPNVSVTGIGDQDMAIIRKLFTEIKDENGEKRHREWLKNIAVGVFSFGQANISYDPYRSESWKAKALGTSSELSVYKYKENDEFLSSDWKMFHDALQEHRLSLLRHILPQYGICAG